MNIDKDTAAKTIAETVHLYFTGTYDGDSERLKRAFHADCRIVGFINGDMVDWSLNDFISRVTAHPTARERNDNYDKQIISIDHTADTAVVKARVVVGPLTFTDYILLVKINGQWIIRSKSFSTSA